MFFPLFLFMPAAPAVLETWFVMERERTPKAEGETASEDISIEKDVGGVREAASLREAFAL